MSDQVPSEFNTPYDFSGSNISGFIRKINADPTPLQTLTGDIAIHITDDGIGGHAFAYKAVIFGFSQFGAPALVTVPANAETIVGQGSVGIAGWYIVNCVMDNGGVALTGTTILIARLRAGTGLITDPRIGANIVEPSTGGTVNEFATNVFSYALPLLPTDVISATLEFNVGGDAPMDIGLRANFIYLGAV